MVEQSEVLEYHPDLAAQRRRLASRQHAHIVTENREKATGRPQAQMHHVQQGGFAGAARAGQKMETAGFDRDADVMQYLGADAIPEADVVEADHRDSGLRGIE